VKDKQKYFEKDEAKKNKTLNSTTITTTTTTPTIEEKANPLVTKTDRVKRGNNVKSTTTIQKGPTRNEKTEAKSSSKKWEDWKVDSESISPNSTASKDSKESSSTGKSKVPSTIKSQ